MDTEPLQLLLPMLHVYEGPRLLPADDIVMAHDYREAVRLCWLRRTRRNLTMRQVAEETGMRPSHLSEYLSDDATKREMPFRFVKAFEVSTGNLAITQWHNLDMGVPLRFQEAQRRAA